MIKLLRAAAVIGGLVFGLALPASASADYATTLAAVNLRAGAGAGFARLATIPAGASLWVEFCQPQWCRVVWRKRNGWVSAAYLSAGYRASGPIYDGSDYQDYFENYDDDYYYGYGYGFPDPYFWRHHRHHHNKPGKPHCKPGDCQSWPKPGKPPKWDNKPPKWDNPPKWDKPRKWDGPTGGGGPQKEWRHFDRDNGSNPGGQFIGKSPGGNDGGHRGSRRWDH